jgi:hypothetical protein
MIISRNKEYKDKKVLDGEFLTQLFIGTFNKMMLIYSLVYSSIVFVHFGFRFEPKYLDCFIVFI